MLQESSQTLDAPPPFSVASLFPPKACQPSTPKAKQPQLCQQQLSVVSDNQTDSMQATCLDTPSPIFLRRQQSVSTSPPMSRQHGPSSSSPAQGSIILCGKPLSLNSRTASAPSSTFQDQPFSFRQHQPPVKRTWSDSTQYVQRNLSHYASLGQEQCNRSLSAHKARGAGEHIVPEFQHPAKKHQVEVDGRPSFPLWPDQHLTANQQSRTDEQARTDQHSRAMHPLPEQARRQSGQLSQPQQTGTWL